MSTRLRHVPKRAAAASARRAAVVAAFAAAAGMSLAGAPAGAAAAKVSRADLIMSAKSQLTLSGGAYSGKMTVKNTGRRSAKKTTAALSLTLDAPQPNRELRTFKVGQLDRGESATFKVSIPAPSGLSTGDHELVVCADTKRQVSESDEKNNCRTVATITVAGPPPVVTPQPPADPTPQPPVITPPIVEPTPPVSTPAVTTPGLPTGPPVVVPPVTTAPLPSTPKVTTPGVTTPKLTTPAATTPKVTTPAITTPKVTTPAVTTPQPTTAPLPSTPQPSTPQVSTPPVTTPPVTTPEPTTPAEVRLCGPVDDDLTLSPAAADVYVLDCTLTVKPGATLTVEAGTKLDGNHYDISVEGSLKATGTADAPVAFGQGTSWMGIEAQPGASVTLDHADIVGANTGFSAYEAARAVIRDSSLLGVCTGISISDDRSGDNDGTSRIEVSGNALAGVGACRQSGTGIVVNATGAPTGPGTQIPVPIVRDNSVNDSHGGSFYIYGDALDPTLLTGNTADENNQFNWLGLGGTLTKDLTLPLSSAPLAFGKLNIPAGVTMTIPAGSDIRPSTGAELHVDGKLVSNGTEQQPVTITSRNPMFPDRPAGDWRGITAGNGAVVELTRTTIGYAANGLSSVGAKLTKVLQSQFVGVCAGINLGLGPVDEGADPHTAEVRETTIDNLPCPGGPQPGIDVTASRARAFPGSSDPITSVPAVPTIQDNVVNGSSGFAVLIRGDALDVALLTGNEGTGNAVNQIQVTGTAVGDLDLPFAGLQFAVGSRERNPAVGVHFYEGLSLDGTITMEAGTVVKVNPVGALGARLISKGTADSPVIFTALNDDAVGGNSNPLGLETSPIEPHTDLWRGIQGVTADSLAAQHIIQKYVDPTVGDPYFGG